MSNHIYTKAKQEITSVKYAMHIIIIWKERSPCDKLCSGNPEMTNLRTENWY